MNGNGFKPSIARLGVISVVIVILLFALVVKIFKVQFIDASDFKKRANEQYARPTETIKPNRGEVLDRNGIPLATNVLTTDIACEPKRIYDPDKLNDPQNITNIKGTAEVLAKFLGMDPKVVEDRLNGKGGSPYYTRIKRGVDPDVAERIRAFNLKGIIIEEWYRRSYPEGTLASPLLGFAGIDNQGLVGIEWDLNKLLAGQEGLRAYPTDTGAGVAGASFITLKPVIHGKSVYLTIDSTIQFFAEQELERTCKEWNAKGGSCVVMDPATGEILALANCPLYDPNKGINSPINARNNRALTYTFEPGSVVKGIITAAALEKKTVKDDSKFFCSGSTTIEGHYLRCVGTHGHQELQDALRNSCNMAFIEVGKSLKGDLFKYLSDFGFGSKPGAGLFEEGGVLQRPKGATMQATMSYGQGMSVTPLQLAAAYSAIANGGVLMKPILLRQIYDPNKGTFEKSAPQPLRQAVTKETSDHVLFLLSNIVNRKGIDEAVVAGYEGTIAGKTGTAPKTFAKGGYDWSQFNCSFCGIVPTYKDAPKRVVIFVTVDDPNKRGVTPFGSTVAAPCFKRLAEKVLSVLRIAPKEIK